MVINGYSLTSELQNKNSGFSKWAFATKNGKEYFIKELLNPVYPVDRSIMTDEVFTQKMRHCMEFEERFRRFYNTINRASKGNLVRIVEFFREGSKYYIINEKIDSNSVDIKIIPTLPLRKRLLLLKTIARGFYDLHSSGIVHFDVKTANILIQKTANQNLTAKIIDFDAGFFIGDAFEDRELGADLTHLAPETFLRIIGEPVSPGEKADIFALGLIFHEYLCGCLPKFNVSEYDYPYEAALEGDTLAIDRASMPEELANLISSMLEADPEKRPKAKNVMECIDSIYAALPPEKPLSDNSDLNKTSKDLTKSVNKSGNWFSAPGDL
ncbi:MAG: protein kinase [Clostridia bacterium]|nr:protein kinase [Clostridia bacterium]